MALVAILAVQGNRLAFAQSLYGGGDTPSVGGVTNATLQKCEQLGIARSQCNDQTILAKERIGIKGQGSGTPMIATQSGQMLIFVGVLGVIFGGVAAAFLLQSRRSGVREKSAERQR
ncbi:MAG: hypothetical protein ABI361_08220 [Nitrososphaera sp.]